MSVSSLASFEYLERLPGTTFRRLYQQPSTALAIFRRMLPHLASPPSKEHPPALSLAANFSASLRLALTGGDDQQSFGVPSTDVGEEGIDVAFLDEYARSQWEAILHYIVRSVGDGMQQGAQPEDNVQKLLEMGNLVDRRGRHSGMGITQAGFTFLLQEVNAQVWTLLLLWIENAEALEMDSVSLLSFLFTLGSLELGLSYTTTTLSETQKAMLPHLSSFGLIYISPSHPTSFFPTRLSTTLTSDASALRSISSGFDSATATSASKGFIVIETNYRLYAYTSSPLQIAVLALFTKLSTRYPNMVAGRVTRDSIRRAIEHGITSDQIISYLQTHAHPQLRRRNPVLPPTVVDQIRLWQIENERMKATTGFLFKDFAGPHEYDAVVRYADEIGVLIWRSDIKRCFFVTRHEQLRDYIKSRKMK
ncbi:MAG: RNA polymerase II transcription factor B 52 kDa subunit [Claussenomyces sp. TS43310]|nr:MAG: RNA polymerase II transcription factor B 52 kDa subunit [Claussenomyces sp. TS43310]